MNGNEKNLIIGLMNVFTIPSNAPAKRKFVIVGSILIPLTIFVATKRAMALLTIRRKILPKIFIYLFLELFFIKNFLLTLRSEKSSASSISLCEQLSPNAIISTLIPLLN